MATLVVPIAGLVIGLLGTAASAVGAWLSWRAMKEAASASVAATGARDAAISAQRELTAHSEILPQIRDADRMLKDLIEAHTTGQDVAKRMLEIRNRLSLACHAARELGKDSVATALQGARDRLSAQNDLFECVDDARDLLNSAAAIIRHGPGAIESLTGDIDG